MQGIIKHNELGVVKFNGSSDFITLIHEDRNELGELSKNSHCVNK